MLRKLVPGVWAQGSAQSLWVTSDRVSFAAERATFLSTSLRDNARSAKAPADVTIRTRVLLVLGQDGHGFRGRPLAD